MISENATFSCRLISEMFARKRKFNFFLIHAGLNL